MKRTLNILSAVLVGAICTIAATTHAQAPVKPDTVLASNSRAKVTYEDLIAEIARLPEEHRLEFLLNQQRVAVVVENILIGKIMAAEALKTGLEKKPNVAAEIRNQTEKVLTKYRREELEANAPKIDLTALAREIYLTRLKDYEKPALYTSWHTLVKTKDRTREAAMERAKLVKSKIDAGEKLEAIARQYSDDESMPVNAGFIRPTPLSYLDKGFANALEKLKEGETTLVETDYGVHVVRLLKMVPKHRPSFEDMKQDLLSEADKTYKQRIVENYLTVIRSDPTVKLHEDVLDAIRPKLPEIPPPPAPVAPTRQL
jgi:peptidyl-prolyl cis-trans isomerase C